MADKKKSLGKADLEESRRRLRDNERLEPGICYDPARWPEEFYPCTETDERAARGEVSVSWDGTIVQELATGKIERQESTVRILPDTSVAPVVLAPGPSGNVGGAGGGGTRTGGGGAAGGGSTRTSTTEGAHP